MTSRASPKSDLIETILRRQGPLPVKRIVEEMQRAGVDAKPNNVRSLMLTLFKRFVSLKPGVWQLQDPALSYAEKLIAYEEARYGQVSPERIDFLRAFHEPRTPPKTSGRPKLRNGYMKHDATIKDLNQLWQELEKKKEALQTTIDACHVVIALFEARSPDDVFRRPPDAPDDVFERPPSDDDPVTTPEPEVERAPTDVVTTPQRASPGVFHEAEPKRRRVKRERKGISAPCPRCSAMGVTTEDHFSICISCGWNEEAS